MTLLLVLALLGAALHGGQYQPPLPDPEQPEEEGLPVSQPGDGPVMAFQAGRWEWWFDLNQEELVRLRERMATRPTPPGRPRWQPVTDDDRLERLMPPLVDALRSHRRDLRATAALSLGRLARPDALPYIEVVVDDPDLFVRTQAVVALGLSGQPAASEVLVRLLDDPGASDERRIFAAAALGLLDDDGAAAFLARHLEPGRLARRPHLLRQGLIHAAGVSRHPDVRLALARLADTPLLAGEDDLAALAAVATGRQGQPGGAARLARWLAHPDNLVRRSAAAGLEALRAAAPDVLPGRALSRRRPDGDLAESDVPARTYLVHAAGFGGQPGEIAILVDLLERTTALLRPHVALALGLHGDPAHRERLLAALGDQHESSQRGAIAVALGLLGDPSAGPALVDLLDRVHDPALTGYVCLALGLLGTAPQGTAADLRRLAETSHDVEVVRLAVLGLGLLGERGLLADLAEGLPAVRDTVDRAARLQALGRVGDRTTIGPVLAIAEDETQPSYVVRYALAALGDIGDPRDVPPRARLSRHAELHHDVDDLFELYRLR